MDSIIREVLTADPDKAVVFKWEDRALQGINRKKGIKHVPLKPPPVPVPPPALVPVPVPTLGSTHIAVAPVVPAAVPDSTALGAGARRYVCRANPAQAGKFTIVPAAPIASPVAGAAAGDGAHNDDSAAGSGVGRFVDLTADDGAARPAAQPGNHFFRKAHVSYGVGIERLKCHCGALIKPKHVRIRVTDSRTATVSLYYHSWCLSSLSFRQHQISFEKISGREKLTPEDREQLRLNYDLVV